MHLLVTGAAGYLGSAFVDEALARGHTVLGVDALWYGADGITNLHRHRGYTFLPCDIADLAPTDFHGADGVVHFAGFSNDPTADADPARNERVNVAGTARVAQCAIVARVPRFTYAGSASVYDGLSGAYHSEGVPITNPLGHYTRSKYQGEQELLRCAAHAPTFRPTIFRQGTVYGNAPRLRFDLVVNAMVRDAVCTGIITVHRPGTQCRPMVSVRQVVDAHLWAMGRDPEMAETFNLAGENYTVAALARHVVRVLGCAGILAVVRTQEAGGRVRDYRVSVAALRGAMGPPAYAGTTELAHQIRTLAIRIKYLADPYAAKYTNLAALAQTA